MKTALLIILQLAASGSDAYFTHRNAQYRKFGEDNPIARPFVRSTVGTVGYFGAGAAVKIAVPRFLGRHHPKFATGLALAGVADNTEGAAYSATH